MIEAIPPLESRAAFWSRPAGLAFALFAVILPLPVVLGSAAHLNSPELGLLAVPIALALASAFLRLRGGRWSDLGFRRPRPFRTAFAAAALATVVLLVALPVLGSLLAMATGLKPDISQFDPLRGNWAALAAGLVLVWTVAAFGEELLFRGYILDSIHRLVRRTPDDRRAAVFAAILVAVLFGISHSYQGAAGAILTGIIGLAFGLIVLAAHRNLWPAVLAHGLYDTAGFIFVFLSLDQLLVPAATFV